MSRSRSILSTTWHWILALMVWVSGCNDGSLPGEGGANHEKVVAVGSQWYGHIPVWVGIERGIFERKDYILAILHEQMGALPRKPAFRDWVRLDLLPGTAPSGKSWHSARQAC
jgi:hypothetical protein